MAFPRVIGFGHGALEKPFRDRSLSKSSAHHMIFIFLQSVACETEQMFNTSTELQDFKIITIPLKFQDFGGNVAGAMEHFCNTSIDISTFVHFEIPKISKRMKDFNAFGRIASM